MDTAFNTLLKHRNVLLQILNQTPLDRLVEIPQGFNNNIWWNIAHVVVTQQLLMYKLSNLPMATGEELVANYRRGTFPSGQPSGDEVALVKTLLLETALKAKTDYSNGIFKEFTEFTTVLGVSLRSVEDAIVFNTYHEGFHLGVVLSLRHAVGGPGL